MRLWSLFLPAYGRIGFSCPPTGVSDFLCKSIIFICHILIYSSNCLHHFNINSIKDIIKTIKPLNYR